VCDLDVTGVSSIFKIMRSSSALGHAVATKCERQTGQDGPWRHGSIIQDRVDSSKESQDIWMKTFKIKYMYENMQKQRENSHHNQEAGQHLVPTERGSPEAHTRKEGVTNPGK
jgi:hypothetical protein